jgi:hypothetical protein
MNKGLIALTNEKYLPLTEAFVESILKFSSLPATIFTMGFNYNFKNNRITNKQLDLELNKDSWAECCVSKLNICSQTPYDITFYLDADSIITKEFEPWLNSIETTIVSLEKLFCCKHPHFPCNKDNHSLLQFFKKFGLGETSNYVFAAGYAYNRKFTPHFLDMYKKAVNLLKEGIELPTGDECFLNVNLLQNNLIYDSGYDFLPSADLFNSYINKSLNPKHYFHPIYLEEGRYIKPVLFHGNKNVNQAWHMIEEIEKHT